MFTGRLILTPIRASLFAAASPSLSRSRIHLYDKFEPLKAWVKGVRENTARSSGWRLCAHRYYTGSYGIMSQTKFAWGSVLGVPFIIGLVGLGPRTMYAVNGFDFLEDDHHLGLSDAPDVDSDKRNFLAITRKVLLPFLLLITVLMNWDHPVLLAAKVVLILVGTKPSPLSIYIFIEQLRRQFMREHPIFYRFKSLYANKVEVEDYAILCVGQVEIKDQKFTLVGILGCWWVLPRSPSLGSFSVLKDKLLQKYVGYGDA